jgi:AraC-like DNA-binding protein
MNYTYWPNNYYKLTLHSDFNIHFGIFMDNLTLSELRDTLRYRPLVSHEDFFIMNLSFHENMERYLTFPCRFAGVICLYCVSGQFDLRIGMEKYKVAKDCFAISLPEDILSFSWIESSGTGNITIMAISEPVLQEMEFDRLRALHTYRYRMVKADTRTMILIHNFRNIFRSVTGNRHEDARRSLAYLLRSMNIELSHIWESLAVSNVSHNESSHSIVEQFIALLARYHTEHRDLQFYANRMGLTPKYLSSAIKTYEGHTAPEWIAEYVLMEARYYLRYTEYPIKMIAWKLNFKNQMDFYRYFKRHTGMTPSFYREQSESAE